MQPEAYTSMSAAMSLKPNIGGSNIIYKSTPSLNNALTSTPNSTKNPAHQFTTPQGYFYFNHMKSQNAPKPAQNLATSSSSSTSSTSSSRSSADHTQPTNEQTTRSPSSTKPNPKATATNNKQLILNNLNALITGSGPKANGNANKPSNYHSSSLYLSTNSGNSSKTSSGSSTGNNSYYYYSTGNNNNNNNNNQNNANSSVNSVTSASMNNLAEFNTNNVQPKPSNNSNVSVKSTAINYNLAVALKAATAALQKSKITASSTSINNDGVEDNSANKKQSGKFITYQQVKPVSMVESASQNQQAAKAAATKSSPPASITIIPAPVQNTFNSRNSASLHNALLSNGTSSNTFTADSGFQPYSKPNNNNNNNNNIVIINTEAASAAIKKFNNSNNNNKVYRNTLIIDTTNSHHTQASSASSLSSQSGNVNASSLPFNNQTSGSNQNSGNFVVSSHSRASTASSSSSALLSNSSQHMFKKSPPPPMDFYDNEEDEESEESDLDDNYYAQNGSDYENRLTKESHLKSSSSFLTSTKPSLNSDQNLNLKQQQLLKLKSASTEFLNHVNTAAFKPQTRRQLPEIADCEVNECENTRTEPINDSQTKSGCIRSILKRSSGSPPPPQIQPYSGVLSKSLFSLVHKPQPIKPTARVAYANAAKSVLANNRFKYEESGSGLLMRGNVFKKKCQSTINLVTDSTNTKGKIIGFFFQFTILLSIKNR
jgi:hypothetical protein